MQSSDNVASISVISQKRLVCICVCRSLRNLSFGRSRMTLLSTIGTLVF